MKIALDTNILIYAEGLNGSAMQKKAADLIDRLSPTATCLPTQVLGEFYYVMTRKGKKTPAFARSAVMNWSTDFSVIETVSNAFFSAIDLTADHRFHIWDSVIVATAAEAGCRLLLSQDMQDGFTWGGITIVNPFAPQINPLLEAFIDDAI